MYKFSVLVAVTAVSVGLVALAWHYKYELYGFLPSTDADEVTNVNGVLFDKYEKPFTGRLKDKTDTGYSIYAYKDGKLDGLNVVFSEGRLREIGHWQNGEQNGLFEAWTDKGVLIDHGTFKSGVRDGQTLQYWPDTGKLRAKAYYRNGKLDGLCEGYYPSGTLQLKHMYSNNELHGVALDYFENGKLRSSVTFEHGKQNGPFKRFTEIGNLLEESTLKDGVRNGPFAYYFPSNGKLAMQGTFVMNEYDGELIRWRPDGIKIIENYDNGIANGWQKTYNKQGQLIGEMMLKNGKATGEYRTYDSLGNLIQEGKHKDNAETSDSDLSSSITESQEINDEDKIVIKEVN